MTTTSDAEKQLAEAHRELFRGMLGADTGLLEELLETGTR
jgi:hypothetical protein